MSEGETRRLEGIERGRAVTIVVDGEPLAAFAGESVAAALLAQGRRALRTTARGDARGLYCGIGLCFDCVMVVDGRPNVRTCATPVRDGMQVATQRGDGPRTSSAAGPAASARDPLAGHALPVASRVPLAIVGGGPAGIACAIEAARAGLAVTLIDEAPRLGGQIYRHPPREFAVRDAASLGEDFARGNELRAALDAVADRVTVLRETTVLGVWGKTLLCSTAGGPTFDLEAERVVFATGARDRPVPFAGWTRPGVVTAGGAQVLIKTMRVRPGARALVAGTGPLLLVVANQLHAAGVEVVALLEAGRPRFSFGALWKVRREWGLLSDAWRYRRGLARAGIPVRFHHTVFSAEGRDGVERVTYGPVTPDDWRPVRDRAATVDVDLLVVGFGFVPNSELASLAGCVMAHRHELGGWVPARDERMRTSVAGVFASGDGAGVAGALVAVEEGRVAGITAAEDAGALSAREARRRLRRPLARLRSLARVRSVLDDVSRVRPGLVELATADTTVCRCEEVARAEITTAVVEGARDLQAVKLATRLGMGPCQGRNCEASAAEMLRVATGCSRAACGRIEPRPPIKPVTFGSLARTRGEPTGPAVPGPGSRA